VVVDVADDGPGMTAEQLEHCFDLFFTTKEPGKGTGLGLSVAHHIVEQHGGELTVASPPGAGATFTVSLPIAGEGR
jgi:signal transduction histidine kinase